MHIPCPPRFLKGIVLIKIQGINEPFDAFIRFHKGICLADTTWGGFEDDTCI